MNKIYNNQKLIILRRNLRKNSTDAENKIWSYVRKKQLNNLKFYRQYGIGNYILDFYCPEKRIAIEIDGGQHNETVDKERTEFLKSRDIEVVRFWNNEVLENIEGVIGMIQTFITPPILPLP